MTLDKEHKFRDRIYGSYVEASGVADLSQPEVVFGSRAPTMKRLISRYFPGDLTAKILDLGCGHGTLIHFAARMGYTNAIGVDISPSQIALANRLGVKNVKQGDLMETLQATTQGSLDAVVAFDVIEHFTKDELVDFIDAVYRALKPSGRWIIHAPNGESPFFGSIRYGDFTHEQAFTAVSLQQVLSASGFSKISSYECAPIVHGLKSLVRVLIWQVVAFVLKIVSIAESGDSRSIFTRNFYTVAIK